MNWRFKNPKFLLTLPPMQFTKDELIRPDGCLAVAYLDASLTKAGFYSEILDMNVGDKNDTLKDTFFNPIPITPKFVRIGMSQDKILKKVADFDVIGISSVFTQQTSRCFEISNLIKSNFPDKIIIGGGVNSRNLKVNFFNNSFDIIFNSEAEKSLVDFAKYLDCGSPSLSKIEGISYMIDKKMQTNLTRNIIQNLDDIPSPSWHKLPYKKYWEIGRLWGGREGLADYNKIVRFSSIFTSRGCPFTCSFCHISKEKGNEETGNIGSLRLHSVDRVEEEFNILKKLKTEYIYINDDSFLAKKKRAGLIMERLKKFNFKLADINGINIIHFFKRKKTKLVVDEEFLELLYDAGFKKITLPFESANQRIIDKWCSKKWNVGKCDTIDLVKKLNKAGIVADGNFMIGYPDETPTELKNTFLLARDQMDAGMVGCQFFMVQPFPGTEIFEKTLKSGQLSKDWHWDELGWSKGSIFNGLKVDSTTLKFCWSLIYQLLNKQGRIKEFKGQLEYSLKN